MKTKEPSKVQRKTTTAESNLHGILDKKQADNTETSQQDLYAEFLFTFIF